MPTLEQIQLKIAKLQLQAEAIAAKKASVILNQITSLMHKHGLTTAQIEAHLATRKPRGRPAKQAATSAVADAPKRRGRPPKSAAGSATRAASATTKGKLPPKYRDPETGQTWSGHARPPAWIKNVADRSVYLIAGAAATKKTAAKPATRQRAARKLPSNGAVKKLVRKTRAPKSTANGATVVSA